MVELSIMATKIYKNQTIFLFNGKELEIIPLKIRYLREFMEVFKNIKQAKNEMIKFFKKCCTFFDNRKDISKDEKIVPIEKEYNLDKETDQAWGDIANEL
jgi:hypothetical protein